MELNQSLITVIGIILIVLLLAARYCLGLVERSEDKLVKALYKRIFSKQNDPIMVAIVNQDNLTPSERVEGLNFQVTPETFSDVKESIEDLEIAATLRYNSAADKVQGADIFIEPFLDQPVLEEPLLTEPLFEELVLEEPLLTEPLFEDPALEQTTKDYNVLPQPDLTDISRDWDALDVIEKVGNYEIYTPTADIFKWRLLSPKEEVILTSKAQYISEITCKNGIISAKKTLAVDILSLQLTVKSEQQVFIPILRAKNGKLIGEGAIYSTNAEATEALPVIKLASV